MSKKESNIFLCAIRDNIREIDNGITVQHVEKPHDAPIQEKFDIWLCKDTVSEYNEDDFSDLAEREQLTKLVERFRSLAAQAPKEFSSELRAQAQDAMRAIYAIVKSKIPT